MQSPIFESSLERTAWAQFAAASIARGDTAIIAALVADSALIELRQRCSADEQRAIEHRAKMRETQAKAA